MSAGGSYLKEQGQQLALFNAGTDWSDYIIEKLRAFCKARKELGMSNFKIEDFRDVAIKSGWRMPPSPNAFGALPRIACKAGLIKFTGEYQNATSPRTRAHPVKVWVAL